MGLRAASNSTSIAVGGSILDVSIDSDAFELGRTALLNWVTRSAMAATAYFGSFPVAHRWIEEGIATYVEPIARASVGILTAEQVWAEMMRDMRQGLPQPGDRGLDQTHTWGRTYWGGALFCLFADVELRKRTGNSKGLRDALRAINRAGGTIDAHWPLERAFEIGDKATDGGTLMELYGQMGSKPVTVDLPHLWAQLGVISEGQGVAFDDQAPLAAIRSGIC
jgi:hypothetical protein